MAQPELVGGDIGASVETEGAQRPAADRLGDVHADARHAGQRVAVGVDRLDLSCQGDEPFPAHIAGSDRLLKQQVQAQL